MTPIRQACLFFVGRAAYTNRLSGFTQIGFTTQFFIFLAK
jgi:hypothetical protein